MNKKGKDGWNLPCTGCGKMVKPGDKFNAFKTTITFQAWKGKDAPRDMAGVECSSCYKVSWDEYAKSIGKPGIYRAPRCKFPALRCIQCGHRIAPWRKLAYRARYEDVKNLIGATCLPCATRAEADGMEKKFRISDDIAKHIRHENIPLVTIRHALEQTSKKFPGIEIGVAGWKESRRIARSGLVDVIGGTRLRNSRFQPWWKAIFLARECEGIEDELKSFVAARIDDKVAITGGVFEAGESSPNEVD
jgi:DNA-directed RNA polymerase subunit N (RpoN/RPB10)